MFHPPFPSNRRDWGCYLIAPQSLGGVRRLMLARTPERLDTGHVTNLPHSQLRKLSRKVNHPSSGRLGSAPVNACRVLPTTSRPHTAVAAPLAVLLLAQPRFAVVPFGAASRAARVAGAPSHAGASSRTGASGEATPSPLSERGALNLLGRGAPSWFGRCPVEVTKGRSVRFRSLERS